MDLRANGLFIVVHEPQLTPDGRRVVDVYEHGREFRWIPDAAGFLIPFAELDPAVSLIRPAHQELIRLAIQKSDRAVFRSAHSPGVLACLRTLGQDIPDPSHADRDGQPSPPTPVPGSSGARMEVHPVYSVEDFATDTNIEPRIVEGWIRSINRKGQAILYGPPGTGKTYLAERICRHLLSGGDGHSDIVQFHPAYAYEDFIQGLRPQVLTTGALTYDLVPGRFMEFAELHLADRVSPFC